MSITVDTKAASLYLDNIDATVGNLCGLNSLGKSLELCKIKVCEYCCLDCSNCICSYLVGFADNVAVSVNTNERLAYNYYVTCTVLCNERARDFCAALRRVGFGCMGKKRR